jgi:hypothetical protein
VVPDLHDFSLIAEAEDVHAGEGRLLSRRCDIAPGAGVCTSCSPASGDEVAIAQDEIDAPFEVRKRTAELLCDQRLSGGSRWRLRRRAKMRSPPEAGRALPRRARPLDETRCRAVRSILDPKEAVSPGWKSPLCRVTERCIMDAVGPADFLRRLRSLVTIGARACAGLRAASSRRFLSLCSSRVSLRSR